MTPQLGLAQKPRGELAKPEGCPENSYPLSTAWAVPRSQKMLPALMHRQVVGRLAGRKPKNESKTDQRESQPQTGCSDFRRRTRQSSAMQLSRPPVGWENSSSSGMFPQNRKGNHSTTSSCRQPRPADEGASIVRHQFRPLSSSACPPTAPRMGQPPWKETPSSLANSANQSNVHDVAHNPSRWPKYHSTRMRSLLTMRDILLINSVATSPRSATAKMTDVMFE